MRTLWKKHTINHNKHKSYAQVMHNMLITLYNVWIDVD